MVWFFERANEKMRVETRFDKASNEYVLEMTRPGQPPEEERFRDRTEFETRLHEIEAKLEAERWVQVSAEVLPPGWRGAFTN